MSYRNFMDPRSPIVASRSSWAAHKSAARTGTFRRPPSRHLKEWRRRPFGRVYENDKNTPGAWSTRMPDLSAVQQMSQTGQNEGARDRKWGHSTRTADG